MNPTVSGKQQRARARKTGGRVPEEAHRVLHSVFGFEAFRPGQEEVVQSVLEGRDTLAVMPTSGGKSLCYQVPALMKEGLTLVVSPLVSLMADQEISLRRRYEARGLGGGSAPIAALHSGLEPAREREVMDRVRSGRIRVLLVAPERLRSLSFVLSLRRASSCRGVALFVVDEAHCVSEWGHSFRPEYLHAKRVAEDLRGALGEEPRSFPVLALTATADPRVREDVVRLLGMREPRVVMTGVDRPNLSYAVEKVAGDEERAPRVHAAIRRSGTPAIVYAHSRRACEGLAEYLAARALRAEAYHAGMPGDARVAVQERFMSDETDVVVATVAFGMGVDKPDVRNVVHANLPSSIPAYVQEAGRAGRDGRPASCTVIHSPQEVARRKRLAAKDPATAADAERFFDALKREAATSGRGGRRAYLSRAELSRLGGLGKDRSGDVLRALEAAGAVERRYDLWESASVEGASSAKSREGDEGPVASVLAALRLLSRRGGKKQDPLVVELAQLAREAGIPRAVTQGAVTKLAAEGRLIAAGRGSRAELVLKTDTLLPEDLQALEQRFLDASLKEVGYLEDVENYTSPSACRRKRLLSYFGDEAARTVAPCDGCDVCRAGPRRKRPARLKNPAPRPAEKPEKGLLARIWQRLFS